MKALIIAAFWILMMSAGTIAQTPATMPVFDPATAGPEVTNPYFPLKPGELRVYEGTETDSDSGKTVSIRVEESDLSDPVIIAGVETTAVEVREYSDGELSEVTVDYYAQDEEGSVWYLGEAVDTYENGQITGHESAWKAGENGATPGLFMPAEPATGQVFQQEQAPGVAEDTSTITAVDLSVTVGAGTFENCLQTHDVNPLDGGEELKWYCAGTGLVKEEADGALLELTETGMATPVASPSV